VGHDAHVAHAVKRKIPRHAASPPFPLGILYRHYTVTSDNGRTPYWLRPCGGCPPCV
jgi:hypothetical protein